LHDRKASVFLSKKSLIPFQGRRNIATKSAPLDPNFKRIWEKAPASKNAMLKEDKLIYMRPPPVPLWKDIEQNYDDDLATQI